MNEKIKQQFEELYNEFEKLALSNNSKASMFNHDLKVYAEFGPTEDEAQKDFGMNKIQTDLFLALNDAFGSFVLDKFECYKDSDTFNEKLIESYFGKKVERISAGDACLVTSILFAEIEPYVDEYLKESSKKFIELDFVKAIYENLKA